ncbi:hypothetical protein [Streptomyces griseocarneus]|uniref:hypothetical protein n=1 Tax=Streptomyces griseocarneus TaxID=51201 RepID=UPI00167E7D86|nr:hypothetical protein [Streptomyces griseocarneus]MBZ6476561.1 hypothetical protein [Streptomyces griseocarneus]GHG79706.1 hypothetical protein GCM10018779_60680 [Streptomyces griseocarneus]
MSENTNGSIAAEGLAARDPAVRDAPRTEPAVVPADAVIETDEAGGARHRPGRVAASGERRLHSGPGDRLEPNAG